MAHILYYKIYILHYSHYTSNDLERSEVDNPSFLCYWRVHRFTVITPRVLHYHWRHWMHIEAIVHPIMTNSQSGNCGFVVAFLSRTCKCFFTNLLVWWKSVRLGCFLTIHCKVNGLIDGTYICDFYSTNTSTYRDRAVFIWFSKLSHHWFRY